MALKDIKIKLDGVSPSFCIAKWMQVTTTLYNGMTHSCHHPGQHKIPLSELEADYKALHNTSKKIKARQDMLNGVQTSECDYCWRIENLHKEDVYSDRVYKSSEYWATENFQKVIDSGVGTDIVPSYFEVAFDNTCTLACHYCLPEVSSKILNETEKHGPYVLYANRLHNDIKHLEQKQAYPIRNHEYNPYIEAFWKWWPELKTQLSVFRITGGEPLLSKHTMKIIDDLIANPQPQLEFAVNTNLCVPENLTKEFFSKIPALCKSVKQFTVYSSAEAMGDQLEYSRFGLKWDTFIKDVEECVSILQPINNGAFVCMATVNMLSVPTLIDFLEVMDNLKAKYGDNKPHKIGTSLNFLRHPAFSCLTNLNQGTKEEYSKKWLAYAKDESNLLNHIERQQLIRLVEFMNSKLCDIIEVKNQLMFFDEYDKRRGTNFKETFKEIYECQTELLM